jgi:hypothetical protein
MPFSTYVAIGDLGVRTRVGTRGTPSIIRNCLFLTIVLILINGKPFVLCIRTQKKQRKKTTRGANKGIYPYQL